MTVGEDGKPVVEIYLRDEQNFSLKGLPAANVSFVLARLEPGTNGTSSTWHAITRKTEAFPGTSVFAPQAVTGTGPRNQATTEPATAGTWTDQQNGVYTYKFAKSLQGDAEIPFDGSMPHRVGFEIRLSPAIPANNPVYTFNPVTNDPINGPGARSSTTTPASPATTASRSTAAGAPTCSTARCATSRIRSMRRPAIRSTSR